MDRRRRVAGDTSDDERSDAASVASEVRSSLNGSCPGRYPWRQALGPPASRLCMELAVCVRVAGRQRCSCTTAVRGGTHAALVFLRTREPHSPSRSVVLRRWERRWVCRVQASDVSEDVAFGDVPRGATPDAADAADADDAAASGDSEDGGTADDGASGSYAGSVGGDSGDLSGDDEVDEGA